MRDEDVLALQVEALEPFPLFGAHQMRRRFFGEIDEEQEVTRACLALLARLLEPLLRVLPDGFEQSVARTVRLELHERFLDEVRQQIDDLEDVDDRIRADALGCLECPAASEHRETAKHALLG